VTWYLCLVFFSCVCVSTRNEELYLDVFVSGDQYMLVNVIYE
jgi:hypothetical protein